MTKYKRPPEIQQAKAAIRSLKIVKDRCEDCGFASNYPCQFAYHHKDGSKLNNTLDNIAVLCHNCHSMYGTGTVRRDSTNG